jgi:hypothetical protein
MNTKKTVSLSIIIGILSLVIGGITFSFFVIANYNFEKDYLQYWNLADKSSTIQAKEEYIAKFVDALESGHERGDFAANNAIFLKTQDNSFVANVGAVKTLANRLAEIKQMKPDTFEYATAIQQITGQEQGEAGVMIETLRGCYVLENYTMVWGWIAQVIGCSVVVVVLSCACVIMIETT